MSNETALSNVEVVRLINCGSRIDLYRIKVGLLGKMSVENSHFRFVSY